MSIPPSLDQLQIQSYKESTAVANQPGVVVIGPDGGSVPISGTITVTATSRQSTTFAVGQQAVTTVAARLNGGKETENGTRTLHRNS